MTSRWIHLLATMAISLGAAGTTISAQAPRTIQVTGNDTLLYSVTTITAKPGEKLTVVLRTMSMQPASQMAHNFVILKPGSNVDAFVMAAGMAKDTGYMPPALKGQVLVASGMAAGGEKVSVTFTAPTKPGTYPYFCSYSGHYSGGMKGVLIVK